MLKPHKFYVLSRDWSGLITPGVLKFPLLLSYVEPYFQDPGTPSFLLTPSFCRSTYVVSSWGGVNWRQMLKSLPVSKYPFSPFILDLYLGLKRFPGRTQHCLKTAQSLPHHPSSLSIVKGLMLVLFQFLFFCPFFSSWKLSIDLSTPAVLEVCKGVLCKESVSIYWAGHLVSPHSREYCTSVPGTFPGSLLPRRHKNMLSSIFFPILYQIPLDKFWTPSYVPPPLLSYDQPLSFLFSLPLHSS